MNKNDKKYVSKRGQVDPKSIKEFKVYVETTLMDFLMYKMPDMPRTKIKSLLAHHQVAVGGVPVSQFNYPLVPEDVVTISKKSITRHERKDLPIIYEDEDIIAINKPSGLLSIASDKEKGRTAYRLISDYVAQFDKKNRIYVVHRLDEDTSGVLIFAKSNAVKEALQNHWQEIVETRAYYAIVEGKMEKSEDVLKDYLTENNLHLVYVTKDKLKGKLSITAYKTIAYKEPYSLLDVRLSSGRKNQIRVQLGHRGHYVVGDDKYGEPSDPIKRLGLHAYRLVLTNPLSGKRYELETPMPDVFKTLFFKTHAAERAEAAQAEARKNAKARSRVDDNGWEATIKKPAKGKKGFQNKGRRKAHR